MNGNSYCWSWSWGHRWYSLILLYLTYQTCPLLLANTCTSLVSLPGGWPISSLLSSLTPWSLMPFLSQSCCSFVPSRQGQDTTKKNPGASLKCQIYSSLPTLWNSNPIFSWYVIININTSATLNLSLIIIIASLWLLTVKCCSLASAVSGSSFAVSEPSSVRVSDSYSRPADRRHWWT